MKVIKTAWILGKNDVPQPWFKSNGSKKVLIARLHSGFAAFAAKPSVTLPVGFHDAMALEGKERQGAKEYKEWKAKEWRDWKAQRIGKHCNRIVFKHKDEIYQDVKNFCNTYEGLKNTYSMARAKIVSKAFPKSACLVVPGHSSNNYRHIPENWKNGDQDLSALEGAAYILGQKTRPTGSHLLLVSQKELTREAELALLSIKQKKRRSGNATAKISSDSKIRRTRL